MKNNNNEEYAKAIQRSAMSLKRYQAIATKESIEYLDIDLEKFQLSEQEAMQDP